MSRGNRARSSFEGLLKLLAIVAIAGGAGVGLGMSLAQLSDDDELSAPAPGTGTAASTTASARTVTVAARTTPAATTSAPAPAPTTAPARPSAAEVKLRVLGAILRPAGSPSGRRRQRARLIMRVRTQNGGADRVTLGTPILRIGSVRVEPDPAANAPQALFIELAAGETRSMTLRYELSGDATPKVTRDRRARLDIGARSAPLRVKIGAALRLAGQSAAP